MPCRVPVGSWILQEGLWDGHGVPGVLPELGFPSRWLRGEGILWKGGTPTVPSPVPSGCCSCPRWVSAPGGTSWHRHPLTRAVPSLSPDKGSIHKVVELPDGVQNIVEIQVFPNKDPIQSMILDHTRVGPCSGGGRTGWDRHGWVWATPGVWE